MSDNTTIGRLILIGGILTAIVAGLGSAILIKQRQVRAAKTPDAVAAQQERDDAARQRREYEAKAAAAQAASAKPAAVADPIAAQFDRLSATVMRWDDAAKLANASPRVSLGQHIAALQAIKRDTAAIDGPACFVAARQDIVAGMGAHIDAMLDFMASTPGANAEERIIAAHASMTAAAQSAAACRDALARR